MEFQKVLRGFRRSWPAFQFGPEHPVVPAKVQAVRFVQHHALKQVKKIFGELRLLVEWIQLATNRSSPAARIPWRLLLIKRLFLPTVTNAGEDFSGLAFGNHLQKNPTAVASKVVTIVLDVHVFVSRQLRFRSRARMRTTHFTLSDFGKYRMKGNHWRTFLCDQL